MGHTGQMGHTDQDLGNKVHGFFDLQYFLTFHLYDTGPNPAQGVIRWSECIIPTLIGVYGVGFSLE